VKETKKSFDKTEDDLKALQSMGQIIAARFSASWMTRSVRLSSIEIPRSSRRKRRVG